MALLVPFLVSIAVACVQGYYWGRAAGKAAHPLNGIPGTMPPAKPEPEMTMAEPEPEEPDEPVTLRVGQRVLCHLTDATKTVGVLRGFMRQVIDGEQRMLALVDVGAGPGMPMMTIEVDYLDMADEDAPFVTYRSNGKTSDLN